MDSSYTELRYTPACLYLLQSCCGFFPSSCLRMKTSRCHRHQKAVLRSRSGVLDMPQNNREKEKPGGLVTEPMQLQIHFQLRNRHLRKRRGPRKAMVRKKWMEINHHCGPSTSHIPLAVTIHKALSLTHTYTVKALLHCWKHTKAKPV